MCLLLLVRTYGSELSRLHDVLCEYTNQRMFTILFVNMKYVTMLLVGMTTQGKVWKRGNIQHMPIAKLRAEARASVSAACYAQQQVFKTNYEEPTTELLKFCAMDMAMCTWMCVCTTTLKMHAHCCATCTTLLG